MTLKLYGNGNIENVTSINADVSSTELGYLDGVTSAIQTQLNNAGKILQVVRATDSPNRSTTSSTYSDMGLSVTITPQKSDSAVLLVLTARVAVFGSGTTQNAEAQIADSSNVGVPGADAVLIGANDLAGTTKVLRQSLVAVGYALPATTSATTYKVRFRYTGNGGQFEFQNASQDAQLYAIEVAA